MNKVMSNSNNSIPQDKTKYNLGDLSENGYEITDIHGSSPQVIVFSTVKGLTRWEISDANPPEHYKRAVEEFDKIDSQIENSISFTKVKKTLNRDLGRALFNAINSSNEDKAVENFKEIGKRISDQIQFHSKFFYIGSSVLITTILFSFTFFLNISFHNDSTFLSITITRNIYEILMGFGLGTVGALISILISSKELKITPNSSRRENLFWGSARIILGGISGASMILFIMAGIAMEITSETLSAKLVLSMVAGFSERYIGQQLKNLTEG